MDVDGIVPDGGDGRATDSTRGRRATFTRTAESRNRAAPGPRSTRQGTEAPARSRPPVHERARRPSDAPQNSPATVGPDPDTNAWSAPASRTAASAGSMSGHSDIAAALEVVDEQAIGQALTGAERGPQVRAASPQTRARCPRRPGDRLPRTPRPSTAGGAAARSRTRGRASGALGSTSSPAPVPSTSPGVSWLGTSEPSSAASSSSAESSIRASRAAIRSTAAASADPPPMPAAIGMCLRIVTWTRGASHPRVPQPRQRARHDVRLLDARAHDLVVERHASDQLELVRERHRLDQRDELVAPVGSP